MCDQCWIEAGKPAHSSPEIERAVGLIGRLYEVAPGGGPLHAVIDDWSPYDEDLQRSYRLLDNEQLDGSPAVQEVGRELLDLLLSIPEVDRHAALAHAHGSTGRDPVTD